MVGWVSWYVVWVGGWMGELVCGLGGWLDG